MTKTPANHIAPFVYLLVLDFGAGLPCLGINAGRLGEGGGEAMKCLKLNREDVEECSPSRSALWYDAALRRDILGDLADRSMSPCV